MNILILNLDSKSFRFELFDFGSLESLKKGEFEMEISESSVDVEPAELAGRQEKIDKLFRDMLRQVGDVSQIKVIGHKVAHGNDKYLETQKIDVPEILELEKLNDLAPLHNPYNLAGIKSSNKYLPNILDYAVFDTAFFKDLPEYSKIYPIPYEYYEESGIYKSGCDGLAHQFAGQQASKKLKKPFDKTKLVSVYLDEKCSVCNIDRGKPVDISCVMSLTKPGDVDSKLVTRILTDLQRIDTEQNIAKKLDDILNGQGGIKGISGQDDYLELIKAVNFGDAKAKLAFEMFIHRIKKAIGAHCAILNEVEAVIFSGKIISAKPVTKKKICDKLKLLEDIQIFVIDLNEELAIAKEIKEVL